MSAFHPLSLKFVRKYMREAKIVGEDQNPCYSRQIGTVLVKVYPDGTSRILSTGYNGPPKHTPHCDSREYLENVVWLQLTNEEKRHALRILIPDSQNREWDDDQLSTWFGSFVHRAEGCKTCPRKLIGAKSGERTELCSCAHGEANAVTQSTEDLYGAWAFCWCGVACWDCTKTLINAGIKRCFFIDDGSYARNGGSDYSFGSRWLFQQAGVEIFVHKPEFYLAND